MKKVYCVNCRWFLQAYYPWSFERNESCTHPNNYESTDTYRSVLKSTKQTPVEKNKSNKCPDHEPKTVWIETPCGMYSVEMEAPV